MSQLQNIHNIMMGLHVIELSCPSAREKSDVPIKKVQCNIKAALHETVIS